MNTRLKEKFGSKLTACVAAIAFAAVLAGGFAVPAVAQDAAPEAAAPAATDPAAPVMTDPAAPAADAPAADAAAGMTEAPADAAAPAAQESVDNPYGIAHMLEQGDMVALSTFVIMVIMSAGSWYIMIMRFIDQSILMRHAQTAQTTFWSAGSLKEGLNKLEPNSAFRAIVADGLKAAEHHDGKLTDQIDLNEWVSMSLQRAVENINYRLQAGVAFLASVGSTAPFVGLFGTVWGILNALIAIGVAGQVSIDRVAGPLGEALIMTAIGLAVAVPAVLGYNMVVRRNKLAVERLRNFSADVHAVLLAGGSKRA
jgi:biopolymer transport protein ExbB